MSNFSNKVDLIYTAMFIILIIGMPQNWEGFKQRHALTTLPYIPIASQKTQASLTILLTSLAPVPFSPMLNSTS